MPGMGPRAFAILVATATAAPADYDPSQYPAYETCALCHGLFGVSHMARFPNLAGQKQAYIEAQVHAFRAGTRTNDGGQMATIATELHPEDIPFVADWFSSQEPPPPYPTDMDTAAAAALFERLACAECHDNRADGAPDVPYLTAQHPGYLAKQMTDFRDGRREVAALPGLHRDLLSFGDDDIAAIAAYLGAESRP